MTQIERITSKGQLVPLVFMQDNVAASQSNVQLPISEGNDGTNNVTLAVDEYVMPFDGEVVAISAELSAAATAGSLTIGPSVDGTEDTSLQLTVTTATEAWATVPRETIRFLAGDRIGAEITTDGTWDGTTSDLGVVVWCLQFLEGI